MADGKVVIETGLDTTGAINDVVGLGETIEKKGKEIPPIKPEVKPEVDEGAKTKTKDDINSLVNEVNGILKNAKTNVNINVSDEDLNIVSSRIDTILSNTQLTTSEKVRKINTEFKKIGLAGVGENVQKNVVDKVEQGMDKAVTTTNKAAKASKNLDKETKGLNGSLNQVGTTGAKSMQQISKGAEKSIKSMDGLKSALGKIAGILVAGFSLHALFNMGKQATQVASDLVEVDNVVQKSFGNMRGEMDALANSSIKNLGISRLEAYKTGSTFMSMGKMMLTSSEDAKNMALSLTKLSANMASFYNTTNELTSTALKSVFTGETETLKQYGVVMTEANLKQFALTQGITKSYTEMTQSERVMLRYQYITSQLAYIGNDFIDTQDTWANQTRILKENWKEFLTVIGTGLISVLTPLIKTLNIIITKLIELAKTIGSVLADIFGIQVQSFKNTASAVDDVTTSYDDATDALDNYSSATKKAKKETNKALASYDKLNVISTPSASSANAGKGGSGGIGGTIPSTTPTLNIDDSNISKVNDKLSKVFDNLKSRLTSLITLFKTGFKDGLGKDFDKSIERAKKHLLSIKTTLSNIINDPNVKDAGLTFAESLSKNLGKVTGSATSIGQSIIENLIGGMDKFLTKDQDFIKTRIVDLFDIGTEISNITGDLAKALATIGEVFRSDAAKTITGSLFSIVSTLALTAAGLVGRVSTALYKLLVQPIIDNATDIKEAIEETLEPISLVTDTISTGLKDTANKIFEVWDTMIKPVFDEVTESISHLVSVIVETWTDKVAPVLDILAAEFTLVWQKYIQPCIDECLVLIGNIIKILGKLWTGILEPLISWLVKKFGTVFAAVFLGVGTAVLGAVAIISKVIKTIAKVLNTVISLIINFKATWSKIWEAIKAIVVKIWSAIKSKISTLVKAIKTIIVTVFTAIKTTIGTIMNSIKTVISTVWSSIKTVISTVLKSIKTVISTIWNGIKTAISTILTAIKTVISTVWGSIKKVVTTVVNKLKTGVVGAFTALKNSINTVMKSIKRIITNIWNSIWGVIKKVINSILSGIEGMCNGLIKGINFVIDALNKLSFDVPDWVPEIGGETFGFNLTPLDQVSIPRLAQGSVLPANNPFMAIVGDQKHGTNIETPLATMVEAFNKALDQRGGADMPTVQLILKSKVVAEAVWDEEKKKYKQTGSYRPRYS